MRIEKLYPILCVGLLSACASVTIPNTRVCAAAGVLSAGADCAYTGNSNTETLTFDEFLDFIEAQEERPDPKDPTKKLPAHGAALCQSSEDYTKVKIALEQACKLLKGRCTPEMQKSFRDSFARVEKLQQRTRRRP